MIRSLAYVVLSLATCLLVAVGCSSSAPEPDQAASGQPNSPGQPAATEPVRTAAETATPGDNPRKPADPQAVAVLRQFMLAVFENDEAQLRAVSVDHPELNVLLSTEPAAPDAVREARDHVASIEFHSLAAGDKIFLYGQPYVLEPGDIQPGELMLTFEGNEHPFFLQKQPTGWKVRPESVISVVKAARQAETPDAAAPATAGQNVPQPSVQSAEQLGSPNQLR